LAQRRKHRKKTTSTVVAVQLDLETAGFTYVKWDNVQSCKRRDWLVNNDGDIYTVDGATFERTYTEVSRGIYQKTALVWAEVADESGTIQTLEGATSYEVGDYLVYDDPDGKDGYAVSKRKFEEMYSAVR